METNTRFLTGAIFEGVEVEIVLHTHMRKMVVQRKETKHVDINSPLLSDTWDKLKALGEGELLEQAFSLGKKIKHFGVCYHYAHVVPSNHIVETRKESHRFPRLTCVKWGKLIAEILDNKQFYHEKNLYVCDGVESSLEGTLVTFHFKGYDCSPFNDYDDELENVEKECLIETLNDLRKNVEELSSRVLSKQQDSPCPIENLDEPVRKSDSLIQRVFRK